MGNTNVALIPAYEPAEELLTLVKELKAKQLSILVVNDGSPIEYDDLFEKVKEYAEVVSYRENQGKGNALKTGLTYIKENLKETELIVTLDADGQHTVKDTLNVLKQANKNKNSLTLGCRSFGENTPARSMFGNSVTRWIYRMFTGIRVTDTQTGLRAFPAGLIDYMLKVPGERFEYEMNVLLDCPKNKIPICEVPIETIYFDKNEHSHFRTFADSFLVYKPILLFALSSFCGFIIDYTLFNAFYFVFGLFAAAFAVPVSNVLARLISGTTNYFMNKKLIFKYPGGIKKTASQYFILALIILAGNTVLLSFLVDSLQVPAAYAKICTEVTFFVLSFLAQRFLIFRNKPQADTDMGKEQTGYNIQGGVKKAENKFR